LRKPGREVLQHVLVLGLHALDRDGDLQRPLPGALVHDLDRRGELHALVLHARWGRPILRRSLTFGRRIGVRCLLGALGGVLEIILFAYALLVSHVFHPSHHCPRRRSVPRYGLDRMLFSWSG